MSPREFIFFARRVIEASDCGPAEIRSATSRAYYGAFLSIRTFLEKVVQVPCRVGGMNEHQMVQRYLINSQVPEAVELGHMLATLQQARKMADYEMEESIAEDKEEALLNVDRAERILAALQACSGLAIQQRLKAGITQYRRLIKGI
jgi:uncharacterized protein (UPF0332 family)